MIVSNTAKSAELQVMIWFLESGWEVFMPIADINGSDMVVRHPTTSRLVSVQVKHKQPGSKNEGQINNPWNSGDAPFDYLVFFQPSKSRGVILPKIKLKKEGRMFLFFALDKDRYSTGKIRPIFNDFGFDFSKVPHEERAREFTQLFSDIQGSEYTA